MVQEFYPFEAGAGAAVTETQWRRMARVFAPVGVEAGLTVGAGTGTNVNVAAGSAMVDGHYYRTDATVAVPFTANTLASPQTVTVVARMDPTANTITLATTKVALVQQSTGVYELALGTFMLPATGSAQVPYDFRDVRWPLGGAVTLPQIAAGNWSSATEIVTHGPYTIPAWPLGVGVPYRISAWGSMASTVPAGAAYFWPIRIDGSNVGPLHTYTTTAKDLLSKDINDGTAHNVRAVYQGTTATNNIAGGNPLYVQVDRLL